MAPGSTTTCSLSRKEPSDIRSERLRCQLQQIRQRVRRGLRREHERVAGRCRAGTASSSSGPASGRATAPCAPRAAAGPRRPPGAACGSAFSRLIAAGVRDAGYVVRAGRRRQRDGRPEEQRQHGRRRRTRRRARKSWRESTVRPPRGASVAESLALAADGVGPAREPALLVHRDDRVGLDRQRDEDDDERVQRQEEDVERVASQVRVAADRRARPAPSRAASATPVRGELEPAERRGTPSVRPIVTGVSRICSTVTFDDERHLPQPALPERGQVACGPSCGSSARVA